MTWEIKPDQNNGHLQQLPEMDLSQRGHLKSHLGALSIPLCRYPLAGSNPGAHRSASGVGSASPQLQGVWPVHEISVDRFNTF